MCVKLLDSCGVCIFSHNDLAMQLRARYQNQLNEVDLNKNGSGDNVTFWHTDMVRLRAGKVGAQVSLFTLCYIPLNRLLALLNFCFIQSL